jgi:TolB protein
MIYHFFLLVSLFLNPLAAEESLWVELDSEHPLLPLYLADIDEQNAPFPTSYLSSLQQVIAFDLQNSGYIELITKNRKSKEEIVKKWAKDPLYTTLNSLDAYFLVRPYFKDKKLGVDLVAITSNLHKKIEGLDLSGTLSSDRRTLHALSDRIIKEFFQENGISTTKILFTIKNPGPHGKNPTSDLFECDYDGANLRQVSHNGGYIVTPAYVPPKEGGKAGCIFFVSYQNGQPKLFYSALDPFSPKRFSTLKGNQLMPAISRGRDAVAFITDVTGNPDLFLQPIEATGKPIGKPSQIFSTFKATQGTPTFSPNGKEIAFVSNKDGSPRIYVINRPEPGASLKSISAKLISKSCRENTAPNWSSDGKKITYAALTEGVRQIWIYDFEIQKERQLTYGGGNKENPVFAPDSLHIVFNSSNPNKKTLDGSELYIINLHQPNAVQITSGPGEKRYAVWEPK